MAKQGSSSSSNNNPDTGNHKEGLRGTRMTSISSSSKEDIDDINSYVVDLAEYKGGSHMEAIGVQGVLNVRAFGAVGDGIVDDTAALQRTLDAAALCNGVAWLAPVYNSTKLQGGKKKKDAPPSYCGYLCRGSLSIPRNTTLKGASLGMRRPMVHGPDRRRTQGSTLLVAPGREQVEAQESFITMQSGAVIEGVEIYYLEQVEKIVPASEDNNPDDEDSESNDPSPRTHPIPYGYTIEVPCGSHGCTIHQVNCVNPYQFIGVGMPPPDAPSTQKVPGADGLLIDSIQAYPLYRGIVLGRIGDVPRIVHVQFNPNNWPVRDDSVKAWTLQNGVALECCFVEEFMIQNFFAINYRTGFWFHNIRAGPHKMGSYGSINNFGLDKVHTGILMEENGITNRQGLSISNGRIIPFAEATDDDGNPDCRTGIRCAAGCSGGISLTNVSIFARHERSIWIEVSSTVRMTITGGQCTEFKETMIQNDSTDAIVRLMGVRSFNPVGPRVLGDGTDQVGDIGGIEG